MHEWKAAGVCEQSSLPSLQAISYYAKKAKNKAVITNFLTNMPGMVKESTRKKWNKKKNEKEEVPAPAVLPDYNENHNYTDVMKMILTFVRNISRSRKYWRAQFNYMVYALTFASYTCFKHFQQTPDLTIFQFMEQLILEGRTVRSNKLPVDPTNQV